MNNRLLWLAVLLLMLSGVAADAGPVHVIGVKGMIEPAVANYIIRGIARAEDESAEAVVIKLDTHGGLYEPMRGVVYAAGTAGLGKTNGSLPIQFPQQAMRLMD
ncbi:MAG: hypothetical protein HYX78_10695 [Armatimonadetes bacterium]|nr:hypothetical protein [Armatimonadota bacterium]